MSETNKYFDGVIGQERAKRELGFYLDSHLHKGSTVPHLLLTGSKGDGKTHLAKKFARNLPDPEEPTRKNKAFFPFNGGAILNPTMFLEDICSKVQGKYCTIFIDEAHELPKKVETVLLSILEPNKSERTTYTFNDIPYEFDFRLITFIFATTEEDKIFHALKDRLTTVTLEPYTEKDLADIISLVIDGQTEFETPELLSKVSSFVRRNARSADRMAKNIMKIGGAFFSEEHFQKLKEDLNLFPHGITHNEVRALKILESDGECSLGHLSSRLAQTTKSVQKEIEPYLIAMGLMEIDGKRRITGKGHTFLKEISENH